MASRSGYGLPGRPSDGYRPARRAEGPRMGIPRPTRAATETTAIPVSQPKPSRPQPGVRRTGLPQASKPGSGSQPGSWGSASRTSAESRSHTQSGSGSSSSGRSYDEPRLRQAEPLRAFKGPKLVGTRAYQRNDSTSTTSSKRQSQGSIEPGLGIQLDRDITASPAQIQTAEMVEIRKSRPTVYPELDRYREFRRPEYERQPVDVPFRLATHDLPPPTPGSAVFSGSSSQISAISGSPSTKYSESPGPGPYSRDTTPTSMSSQSPVLVAPIRVAAPLRLRQNSPAVSRPPVTRRRAGSTGKPADVDQGLAAVRESMASSSSNSTVRDGDKNKKRDKKPRLPPPPPSPPPRKSSQKFRKNKDTSPQSESGSTRNDGGSRGRGTSPKAGPPPRPSREGTPDMQSQLFEPIPVIQSNLLPLPRERRGSEPATIRSLPGSSTSLPQINKNASTSHLPTATEPRPRPAQKQGGSNSRFLFFGRKKTPADVDAKGVRKGPVAGTGHEGYGRVGAVRRRSASRSDPKSSQDSLVSDSFLADRVNPVVIAGGEIVENRNPSAELARVDSNQSAPARPSTDSKASAGSPARTTLWPSALPRGARRPSDSSTDSVAMQSTLAFRRSVQRLRSPDDPLKLPQPIMTNGGPMSSPMTSFDTSILSEESHLEMQKEISRESEAPKKLQKRPRSPRKWNLFSRSQRSQRPKPKNEPVEAAVVSVEKKPVPFYAMMESEQEEDLDVQEVLRRADVYAASPVMPQQPEPLNIAPKAPAQQILIDGVSGAEANIGQQHPVPSIARPSRLPQVGRIPQVVKQRTEPQSFSRPFRASMQMPPVVIPVYDPESIAKGPTPPRPSTPVFDAGNAPKDPSKLSPEVTRGEREFLAFSPRKNSDVTIGTSSSSSGPSFTATAIIPKPDDPPAEDEVWDEYNDLLGDDKVPQSATSSKDPFHLETYHAKLAKDKPLDSPVVPEGRKEPQSKATSSTYSADMTERIRKAFQPHPSPAAIDVKPESKRTSASSGRTVFSDCSAATDDASPLAQVNLRVGSMTVSKWLTFGHVLFSDIRHELAGKDAPRQSVVVIDGLGNDDWSFYAAETYPAASFYNLSPRAPLPAPAQSPTGFPLSPPNHHQVQYMSHKDKFPFAPQSFDCMVYRFPAAGSEAQYRNIVNEARRVLRPGAFIELSILDVDLNNMGNRGRRTVRRLKEQIHERANDTSLASTADLMVRLLGRAGFTNIRAARVGVPVASSITRAESKPTDAKSKDASLADMMKDNSPMADASITKIVTRVGRWWYTRCYENAAGPANSIWADRALLAECENFGTSLKLTVCCARAPDRIASI
ncbi:hypothetical protein Purlil1_3514 [Purpureocillium lilacinum]|uniref:Methyltransferase type 11 n=1 Tax=Purpureocillium lilacinum TaxID=33203 RepID=A0ABR0C7D4_PURLI|nr:hypothetical protein Purlil1_3514 [Purpureocillium lilacinum]